jgi:signal transduction histidine kinase
MLNFITIGFIPLVLIVVFFLSLFYFIFKQNSKAQANRSLSLMIIFIVLWALVNYLENEISDYYIASFFLYLDFIFAPFIVYYFLKFCLVFTKAKLLKYNTIYLIVSCFVSLLVIFGLIIKDIRFYNETIIFDQGILYVLYSFVLFIYIILGCYSLFVKYLKSKGLYKLQLLYMLLGLLISGLIALITNLVLPQIGVTDVNILRLGIYGMIFFIGFTSYAILKYRLMDIRVIIRRSAVFAVLVLMITSIYTLLAYLISVFFQGVIGTQSIVLNGVITAALVAIGFEPLKKWLSRVTDKFLFKAEYHPQEVIAEFSDKLNTSLDLNKITRFIVRKLDKVFKASFVSIFLLNEDKKQYLRAAGHGQPAKKNAKIDKKLFLEIFNYLKNSGQEREIIVLDEVIKINEQIKSSALDLLIKNFTEHGVNLAVPMYLRDKLVGILFLGDKKSGDVYSQEDLRVLEIIAAHSAVSIQNSKLYQEQKNFAIHLEKVVKERTLELKVANIQLKKLDKAKSEFISIASHQLRTPLTVIKGYISMINEGDFGKIPDQVVNPLDRVYKSTMRIITLVEDLLNISRIESGRMKFEFAKINLEEIVKSVFEELEQHAKNKGLKFIYQPPKTKLPKIILDQKKIREVVMNLMDNAIKYTDKGNVVVSLEKQKGNILYCVEDTGRGLESDEIPMLFQKFSRARGATLVHTEGTGLGLYIAKQMVKKHGGKIWVESDGRNKGSRFCIQFKIENSQLEKDMKKQPKSKK